MAITTGDQAKASEVHDLVREASLASFRCPNRYHHNIQARVDHSESRTLVADRLYAVPFFIPKATTLTKIAINVNTAASGKSCRLGIYDDGGSVYPDSLVSDCGVVDVGSTGNKEITGLSVSLAGKLYWLVVISDGAPVLKASLLSYTTMHWSPLGSSGIGGYQGAQWIKDDTYGALPSTFPSGGTIEEGITIDQIYFEVYLT